MAADYVGTSESVQELHLDRAEVLLRIQRLELKIRKMKRTLEVLRSNTCAYGSGIPSLEAYIRLLEDQLKCEEDVNLALLGRINFLVMNT